MIILILISGFIRKNYFIFFLFYNHYDITMIGHTYSGSDDYSVL